MSLAPARIDPTRVLGADQETIAAALPAVLAAYAGPIASSRKMLELPDDWDGEGSPGYAPETWARAVGLLLGSALRLYEDTGLVAPPPKIRKGPQGSIDLHWRLPGRTLLLNVPMEVDTPAEFFGHDGTRDQDGRFAHPVQGSFAVDDEQPWLLMWVMQA